MSNISDFTIIDGILKRYTGPGGDVVVPDDVIEIGNMAFAGNRSVVSVTLPDSVKMISSSAFLRCENLSHISISEKTTEIDPNAFSHCKKLADSDGFVVINGVLHHYYGDADAVTIPAGVVRINDHVFAHNKLSSVSFPAGLKEIGKYAFLCCRNLSELVIPESVDRIGDSVFHNCERLRTVSLPKEMTSIGKSAFTGCSNLTEIQIPSGIDTLKESVFSSCTGLHSAVIPESVKKIEHHAFHLCGCLQSISLPESLESIGNSAFEGCKNLVELSLPDSVKSIGKEAFKGCTQLRSVRFPVQFPEFGEAVFLGCDYLVDGLADADGMLIVGQTLSKYIGDSPVVNVPDGIKTIGTGAFGSARSLEEVVLPQSVEVIEDVAFKNCANLKKITLPDNLQFIGIRAFESCKSLENITIPNQIRHISSGVFCDCDHLRTVEFPASLETMESHAFSGCCLLENVQLPEGVESIGFKSFSNCSGLRTISIPDSVKYFDDSFLHGTYCEIRLHRWSPKFTEILPELSLDSIHVEDFASVPSKYKLPMAINFIREGNTDLSTPRAKAYMKYLAANSGKIVEAAFEEPAVLSFLCKHNLIKAKDLDLFLKEALQDESAESRTMLLDYQNKLGEKAVNEARQRRAASEEKNERHVADRTRERESSEGLNGLTFVLSGKLPVWPNSAVWSSREDIVTYLGEYGAKVTKTVTPRTDYVVSFDSEEHSAEANAKKFGIKVITEAEFNLLVGKRFEDQEHISVPSWMKSIPSGAFYRCKKLTEIAIPENVTVIGDLAFCDCISLKKVSLPSGLKEIGSQAFSGCATLSEINVPKDVRIGLWAFRDCKLLADDDGYIIFNDELVTCLYDKAHVTIPERIRHIGKGAFQIPRYTSDPDNPLADVSFPSGLLSIEERAFADCKLLKKLALPEGLQYIGHKAFASCWDMKSIWVPESVVQIEDDAFYCCYTIQIFAPAGSYAEQYAKERGLSFSPCDRDSF